MFLHLLDLEQRAAFCRVALYLVRVDAVVDLREEAALERALREMGVAMGDLPPAPETRAEAFRGLEAFTTREAKNVLLLEAAALAASNEELDPDQLAVLADLAERLGLPEAMLGRCRDLAVRAQQLYEEGQALVSPDWSED